MITPEELTGEMVKAIRIKHKITREAFKDRCVQGGLNWGKSVARLCNIEAKDSWKNDDREVVATVINELEGNLSPTDAQLDAVEIGDWDRNEAGQALTPAEAEAEAEAEGLSNADHPAVTSGQSNVDSRGSQTGAHRGAPVPDPDPFAASRRFHAERAAERADALPPVPIWCDDDESEVDDSLVTIEPKPLEEALIDFEHRLTGIAVDPAVSAADITAVPYTQNPDGTYHIGGPLPAGEPLAWNFTNDTEPAELPPWIGGGTVTMELDDTDVQLIELLESDVDTNVFNVSNSLVQTAKRCKRKWWLGWYRGLTPRNENLLDVRSTGTRVHRALQAWYVPDGETPTDPRDALERVLVEDWTKIKTAAEARGHDEFVINDLAAKFEKSASLERAMVGGYMEWLVESGADSQLKIVGAEQSIRVHLYDHVRTDGQVTPVYAMGLLDVQAYRTSDGAKLFMDHKTVGSLKDPVLMLPQNEQMLHYHLLQWLSTPDAEERCDGALYNMLRRVKRTATAKPPFYDRYEVRHNDQELETYRRRLIAETRDIMHMVEQLDAGADPMDVAYPTPTKNCTWDCDFFSICTMFDDGSHVEAAVNSLYHQVDPDARYEPTKGNE